MSGKLSTSGTAADSTLLGGIGLGAASRNNVANKVVRTDGNGYANFGWINTTSGTASGTLTRIYCSQDGYLRYLSPSAFLSSMGIAAGANNYSLPAGSSTTRGGFKIGYAENGKNYPVEVSSEKMYVNVPWVDTNTDTNTQLSDADIAKLGYIKTDTNTVTSIRRDNTGTYRTGNINLVGGTNVTISETSTGVFNISSTDTNTTYSVGAGGLTQQNFTTTLKNKLDGIAASATNVTNNNQLTNGAGYITSYTDTNTVTSIRRDNTGTYRTGNINLVGGTNVSISETSTGVFNISSTDTDTRYSVGDGGLTQKNFTTTLKSKLDGIDASANNYSFPYTVSAGASNSTVVQRNSNGYIFASYFNGTGTFSTTGTTSGMGLFTGTNGTDTYGRSYTAAAARALLNVADGATNVTNNNQLTNGAGYITSYTDTNTTYTAGTGMSLSGTTFNCTVTDTNTQLSDADIAKLGYIKTDTNTTYTADGNYGITLSGTTFRLEDDRRRNSSTTDIYTGNTHDFTWYDASVGIRWYTAGGEDMRLLDNGTLHVDGDVVAYSSTISDERLKDNVTTIENPLDKIKALRGVEYDWNNGNRKGKHDLGLIAQEVESVIPDIVHEHTLPYVEGEEDTLYKTVDYEKMVAVLIEGMKEQQTQIDSLKSELTEIKGKL